MKLIVLILVVSLCQVNAASFAQKITLTEKNVSLEKVINEIRAQTGFDFIGDAKLIRNANSVTVIVKNASLEETLAACFSQTDIDYSIDNQIVALKKRSPELKLSMINLLQQNEVRGRIVDQEGKPLRGASIKVIGTNLATQTNQDGEFVLVSVVNDANLNISFLGYKALQLKAKANMGTITLQPEVEDLGEVNVMVSTGYQTISKERATGSFSSVNQDILERRPVSNLSTALQGTVAGMQAKENADGSVDFLIRGNSTLYADRKPLVVVDGFPISSSDFSDINPNDVESITVLKDAAAASIWGARAANGVIVIVTKRGKSNNKLTIQGSAFSRISNQVDLNQVLTQANSADQVAYERRAFENNWMLSSYAGSFTDINNSLTLAQELLYANKNGQISTAEMNAGLDRLSGLSNRAQVQDLLMQRAILNQYNVNLQAGSERSRTYASIMYENNKGSFKKNGYDRFNMNFSNDFEVNSFLSFNIGANLQYKKEEKSGATISEIEQLSPYEVLLNADGSYGTNLRVHNREQLALIPTGKFPYSDWSYNLLQEVEGRNLSNQNLNARIQAGLNFKIAKGLTFDTKFQYEKIRLDYEDFYDDNTFYVRGLINRMTEYNNNTKTVGKSYIPKGGILKGREVTHSNNTRYDLNKSDIESYLVRNQLNYDTFIGDKHQVTAIAGMEMSQYTTENIGNPYAYGYYSDKLQATTPPYGYGSSVDQFKDFRGNNATVPGGNTVFDWERTKYISFYSNAAYTYNNKYTLSGSVRSDASNFITDDPSLRWSPLWSVGAKWNLRKESFMANLDDVNRLEIRLTYGKNGNVERSTSTSTLLNVGSSLNASTGTITATIADNGNPSLRWEKTTTTNVGIDFSLFRNKLFGSIDLYNKKGDGIIGNVSLPTATGTSVQKFNNAEITNRGIELSLGTSVDIPNTAIKYGTSLNYAYNYNNINSLYNPSLYSYQLVQGAFVEGRPVGSVYAFDYIGMIDGVPHVAGPNGNKQSFNDVTLYNRSLGLPFMSYMGTETPPHTFGWVNNISVHNFNLMAVFVGKMGGVYRNPIFNYAATVGSGKIFVNKYIVDVLAGDPTIPGFANPNETKLYLWDRYGNALRSQVESSSYFEFKELTLDYSLPENLAKSIRVNQVKVFAQTRDLGLIWHANNKGVNPDWLPGTNRPAQTYTFGVNFQF